MIARNLPPLFTFFLSCFLLILVANFSLSIRVLAAEAMASNPVIWADVPDPSVLRVGSVYYMSSTTMHMNPGVPLMKSLDLANWETIGYAYDVLENGDKMNLAKGENEYGKGSWASSLRYHEGWFYVSTFSHSAGKTYIFKTRSLERPKWQRFTLPEAYHDSSLFFDNGRVFLIYDSGDIRIIELTADASALKKGGVNQVLIKDASAIAGDDIMLPAEGAHIQKIQGKYYVSLITWPRGGMRTQLLYRADELLGTYEGKVVLQDRGIAQGSYIDTPDGKWYAMLFRDSSAVGRVPWLIPVEWKEGWPIIGEKSTGRFGEIHIAPDTLDIPLIQKNYYAVAANDEFEGDELKKVWQWNYNPRNDAWSLSANKGSLRLINKRVDTNLLDTQNTLTQRAFGPVSAAQVAMDVSNMQDGDVAGFAAFQKLYAFVGVKKMGDKKTLVMINAQTEKPEEIASLPLNQERVYLRIDMDFRESRDVATFYFSLDGRRWHPIGNELHMQYSMPHFMGYRFALFNFATKKAGGFVDFDFFRVSE